MESKRFRSQGNQTPAPTSVRVLQSGELGQAAEVHCGTRSGSYTQTRSRSVGRKTKAAITGLGNGTKYYLAVTAVGPKGESGYSCELAATPRK